MWEGLLAPPRHIAGKVSRSRSSHVRLVRGLGEGPGKVGETGQGKDRSVGGPVRKRGQNGYGNSVES